MATILYSKDGRKQYVPARRVANMLQHGWSTQKPRGGKHSPAEPATIDVPLPGVDGAPEPVEILTEDQLRAMARNAGIKYYWKKSVDTLKFELGLQHQ